MMLSDKTNTLTVDVMIAMVSQEIETMETLKLEEFEKNQIHLTKRQQPPPRTIVLLSEITDFVEKNVTVSFTKTQDELWKEKILIYECKICFKILYHPVKCINQHRMCKKCSQTINNNHGHYENKCPWCGSMRPVIDVKFQQQIEKLFKTESKNIERHNRRENRLCIRCINLVHRYRRVGCDDEWCCNCITCCCITTWWTTVYAAVTGTAISLGYLAPGCMFGPEGCCCSLCGGTVLKVVSVGCSATIGIFTNFIYCRALNEMFRN